MGSIAATEVAKEVLETIGRGERPSVNKIAVRKGYSPNTAHAGLVQKTKSYQKVIKPFTELLLIERERAIKAMKGKISKAKYRDLSDAIDKLTRNHQLLTGNSTENIQVKPILGGASVNGVSTNNSTE